MPTRCSKDSKGCFCRWGSSGKKYRYICGDKAGKERARSKANRQGAAARASGYKGSYSTGFKGDYYKLTSKIPASEWNKGIPIKDVIENLRGSAEELIETADLLEKEGLKNDK